VCDLVEHGVGTDNCEVIVYALSVGDVPFQKTDYRSSPTQICSEFGSGDPDHIDECGSGLIQNVVGRRVAWRPVVILDHISGRNECLSGDAEPMSAIRGVAGIENSRGEILCYRCHRRKNDGSGDTGNF